MEDEPGQVDVDVVVPVHGGLHHVRGCLASLGAHTTGARVIVVDDASAPYESRRLEELTDQLSDRLPVTVLRNEQNLGYLRSVNRGIAAGDAPFVVTLNSDTVVTPGWLDGLRTALEADPRNAVVCPLSNHANLTRFQFPWGATFLEVADAVRRLSPGRYPEIGLASGFCMLTTRELLEEVGLFDEAYDPGYYEETEFCMQAAARGLRVVADDRTFIYHHGWGTFGPDGRTRLMERNRRVFEERWGDAHTSWQRRIREAQPFAELEQQVQQELCGGRGRRGVGARWEAERERARTPWPRPHPRLDAVTTDTGEIRVQRRSESVVLLLSAVDTDLATTALLQLASELVLDGVDLHVATAGPVNIAAFSDPVVLRPHCFGDIDEMVEQLPAYDVVVATSVDTVVAALALSERDGCQVATLLGEPAGRPLPAGPDLRAWTTSVALARVRHHLVRGTAISPSLSADARRHHVPFGVDLDVFHPAPSLPPAPHLVVPVQARARVAEVEVLQEALRIVMDRLPQLEVTTYGVSSLPGADGIRQLGHRTLAEEAALLRSASVVVDPAASAPAMRSRLRAFAVGVPLVVPRAPEPAGITLPDHNCVAVTPGDPEELSQAILDVVKDPMRHAAMTAAGLATAHAFDLRREVGAARRALERIGPGRAPQQAASPLWEVADAVTGERFQRAKEMMIARHDVTEELEIARIALERAERKLDEVYESETWRVGHAILSFPKLLRRLVGGRGPQG